MKVKDIKNKINERVEELKEVNDPDGKLTRAIQELLLLLQ